MTSDRLRRRIDTLLDEIEAAEKERDWARVRERAEEVLDLDPENADAQAFLRAADRRDRRLEAARATGVTDLGQTTPAPSSGPAPEPARTSAPLPASFAAGRYAVKAFLGEGGRKRVYLAHDTRLDRHVAIALIKVEGLDAAGRERVSREAQAMARLGDHPNVVTVFDTGEEPAGAPGNRQQGVVRRSSLSPGERVRVRGTFPEATQPYIVMEYMAGGSLEDLITAAGDHRIPLPDPLRTATQIAAGLAYAHSKGIVHRDLKPGNVWLTSPLAANVSPLSASPLVSPLSVNTERGSGGEVAPVAKIGDFGLAVALDRSRLTAEGMMLGTVAYMAPEQALGQTPDPRSDLYSLGCILYEMVTGRPPFLGDETVAI